MEFFEQYGNFANFLSGINPDALSQMVEKKVLPKPAPRKADVLSDLDSEASEDDSDVETAFEQKPREIRVEWEQAEKNSNRLPIKTEDGRLRPSQIVVMNSKANEATVSAKPTDDDEDDHGKKKMQPRQRAATSAAVQPPAKQSRTSRRVDAQEQFAALASSIIENPEENIGELRALRELSNSSDPVIQKVGILTQLMVYRDIIPGYRIRKLTDKELAVKVSKDVKKLRNYEETLLSNYQAYLQSLDKIKEDSPHRDSSLAVVGVQCLTELLTSVPHFNFRINIMTAVVSRMVVKSPPEIPQLCCDAISTLFSKDEEGEPTLEAVKLISKMIKARNYVVGDNVLKTFLTLRLKDELVPKNDSKQNDKASKKRKKEQEHVSKKMRKIEKKDNEVEGEMKEAEAVFDKAEREKKQTETLKFVFVTYFRILKNATSSPLLPAVLEGLSQFAHLISVDFFADLLNVLRKISLEQYRQYMEGKADLDPRSSLHCVVAAFQLLSGQGEAINIDLKDFCATMYSQMMRAPLNPSVAWTGSDHISESKARSLIELILLAFDLLFCKRKQLSMDRVSAFVKRLAVISIHLPSNALLACLHMIRALVIKYPKLEYLLDTERLGTGVYRPMLDDPDLCNPYVTNLWELALLRVSHVVQYGSCVWRASAGWIANPSRRST
ncbi:nucleolar complex-associated protein-domain-containing protein [Polychytrium aggregatum]|uniref:nucleolar complex-associated protein-domain-containing protein n=1 Tax=Polychytrium aggregatum TaxID=110093 RepID=UPI0022FDE9CC|nr:nucleolar complex-associated protein-domain-containing protein [Polychytrium aggregatum]KAI9207010.1 nucleolar complex-associated protein-domain-containing protein [Polychytrium aggregatum]